LPFEGEKSKISKEDPADLPWKVDTTKEMSTRLSASRSINLIFSEHSILGPKSMLFCQRTLMSKPRVPTWLYLVDSIVRWLNEVFEAQNRPISDIELSFDEVIGGTGPSAFTMAEMRKREGVDVT
jgi:hypothetical protein